MVILPFLAMILMPQEDYIYAIYGVSLCFLPLILHQNAVHFAPKHIAFSTKTHCI